MFSQRETLFRFSPNFGNGSWKKKLLWHLEFVHMVHSELLSILYDIIITVVIKEVLIWRKPLVQRRPAVEEPKRRAYKENFRSIDMRFRYYFSMPEMRHFYEVCAHACMCVSICMSAYIQGCANPWIIGRHLSTIYLNRKNESRFETTIHLSGEKKSWL